MAETLKVLLADDRLSRNVFLEEIKVTVTSSIAETLFVIEEGFKPDVAIIDLGLGGIHPRINSGIELAKLLQDKGIKVGLFSGMNERENHRYASELRVPFYYAPIILANEEAFRLSVNEIFYWDPENRRSKPRTHELTLGALGQFASRFIPFISVLTHGAFWVRGKEGL